MKACEDCRWYKVEHFFLDYRSIDVCTHEKASRGDPDYLNGLPSKERLTIWHMREHDSLCGHEGKLFESKE